MAIDGQPMSTSMNPVGCDVVCRSRGWCAGMPPLPPTGHLQWGELSNIIIDIDIDRMLIHSKAWTQLRSQACAVANTFIMQDTWMTCSQPIIRPRASSFMVACLVAGFIVRVKTLSFDPECPCANAAPFLKRLNSAVVTGVFEEEPASNCTWTTYEAGIAPRCDIDSLFLTFDQRGCWCWCTGALTLLFLHRLVLVNGSCTAFYVSKRVFLSW